VSRALRASILAVALVVVTAVTASGCSPSYVNPPVLSMSATSAADPYYTLSREDMYKDLNAASTGTSTTAKAYDTKVTAAYLNKKVNEEFLKRFMEEQNIAVTDADTAFAQQSASASSQSSSPSPAQLKQSAQLIAINRKLANDAYASGKVDKDQKLHEFYDTNKAQMATPAQICIHLIGLQAGDGTTAPTDADYADAQTRATAAKARLVAEPFETVADAASQIPKAPKGGAVGCIDETKLPADVQPAVAKLALNATSDPLRTNGGFFIIRVDGRNAATTTPFDQVKTQIEAQVDQQIGQQLLKDVVQEAIRKTDVRIDPRFGAWDPSKYAVTAPAAAADPTMPTTSTTSPAGISLQPSGAGATP